MEDHLRKNFLPSTNSKHQFSKGRLISPVDLFINVTSELPAEGDRRTFSDSSLSGADSRVAVDKDSVPSSTRDYKDIRTRNKTMG